jgi:ribosomal protein S18 acetylase RimI-like enzyme
VKTATLDDKMLHGVAPSGFAKSRAIGEPLDHDDSLMLSLVSPSAPKWQRKFVWELSRVGNRDEETKYDNLVYDSYFLSGKPEYAVVAVRAGYACGLLVLWKGGYTRKRDWTLLFQNPTGVKSDLRADPERWIITFIWVAKELRRQGVATRLVRAASKWSGLQAEEFGWHTPFSKSGLALARIISPQSIVTARLS